MTRGVDVTDAGIGGPSVDVPENPVDRDRWFGWRLRQLAQIKTEMEHNAAVAQAEIDRFTNWRDEQNATLARRAEWLQAQIQQAALAYDFGDKKSRTLAEGTFGFEQRGGSVKIKDMNAAVRWARDHGYESSIKETIGVTPVKQFIESTGVTPEFVEVESKHDAFYVRVSEQ